MPAHDKARLGARLRSERKDRGLVVEDLAEEFRKVAPERIRQRLPKLKDLQRMIRGWEAGEHNPGEQYRLLYCRAFRMDEEELFGDDGESFDDCELPSGPYGGSFREIPPTYYEEDEVERRALLHLLATLGAGAVAPPDALEILRGRIDSTAGARTGTNLEEWQRIAWEYGYTCVGFSPTQLIADLAADLSEVQQLLARSPTSPVRTSLLGVSARLSALMADGLHSLGMLGPAWRWWRTSRRAADESGDRDLRVWVRAREAFNAFHSKRPAASVLALTDEAVHIANGKSSLGLVETHKNRAYALAARGDAANAREALADMRKTFEALPTSVTTDKDSLWGWPERIMYLAESSVYTTLGAAEAAATQEHALSLYPRELRTDITKIKLYQAISLIRDRDVSSGLDHALASIEALPDGRRTTSVKRVATQVLESLPKESTLALPAARDLRALTV